MIIDTHAHLYFPELAGNIDEVIDNALSAGVEKIIVPAVDLHTSEIILSMAAKYDMVYAVLGFHPCDVHKINEKDFQTFENLLTERKIVGIGETGLDYYWDVTHKDLQIEYFKRHLELSSKLDLPVVIHTRNSIKDSIKIIRDLPFKCKGQFHCFSGDENDLRDVLEFETYYISFCGNITYKNFDALNVLSEVPAGKLLSETDSPFLTPVPHRGSKNQPSFITNTINKMAAVKQMDSEILIAQLETNARNLFVKAF